MKNIATLVACLFCLMATTIHAQQNAPAGVSIGHIEQYSPDLIDLIDPDARIELLATGFTWSEGPVWVKDGNYLLFSDVPKNVIYSWKSSEGLTEYLRPSGFTGSKVVSREPGSNGLAIDASGSLILCQHGDRRLAKMKSTIDSPKPSFGTLVDAYKGKRFNSPNDLAIHSNGSIYFTDPPYGLAKLFDDPDKEIDFQGVYRLSPSGEITLLAKELITPNGIALSPDETKLYVAQSGKIQPVIMVYDLRSDGQIENGKVLFDMTERLKTLVGSADGLKVDKEGNLFATGAGGLLILSDKGQHLGTIVTGERISNCAFGDDGRTLYMTSDMHLCRVKLKTTGDGF